MPAVVVGGVAMNLRGVQRSTSDLDLAISLADDSLPAAVQIVQRLGMRCRLPAPESEFSDPKLVKQWVAERNLVALKFTDPQDPLREVDLVVGSPVSFQDLDRSAGRFEAAGLSFRVASAQDLIRMKSVTGREQDEDDVSALRRVLELTRGR